MGLQIDRREFLAATGALGAAALLAGCATSSNSGTPASGGAGTGDITIQSYVVDAGSRKAEAAMVAAFNKRGGPRATINSVAEETFRVQLPTYLSSANPPDVLDWLAGSVARHYASQNLLLDVSDVWQQSMTNYSAGVRDLCTYNGKQIFVPLNYYWWGMFYRKSNFAKWGITPPKTWSDFLQVCKTLKDKGVAPIGTGSQGADAWILSGWFDYLDIRINGAPYHLDLLAGKHSYTDAKVKNVIDVWKQVLPYYDPQGAAIQYQQTFTNLAQGKIGMTLTGAYILGALPKDVVGDIDFFQFPILDPSVPIAEEAPTNGVFASSRTKHAKSAKEYMAFVGSVEGQETFLDAYNTPGYLPINPAAKAGSDPLTQKGQRMLLAAKQLTQFFNRDSSDALQVPATAAFSQFVAHPNQVDSILSTWQAAAEKLYQN